MSDLEQIPKGYKETKIGLMPDDWEYSIFDDISQFFSNFSKVSKV
jgi:hypothetical protein